MSTHRLIANSEKTKKIYYFMILLKFFFLFLSCQQRSEKERKTKRKQSDFLGELAEWRIQCIKRWRRTSIYYPHTHTHTRPVFVLPTKGRGSHKKTPQKYFLPPPPKKRGDIINLEEKKTYFYFPLLNDEIVPKKKREKGFWLECNNEEKKENHNSTCWNDLKRRVHHNSQNGVVHVAHQTKWFARVTRPPLFFLSSSSFLTNVFTTPQNKIKYKNSGFLRIDSDTSVVVYHRKRKRSKRKDEGKKQNFWQKKNFFKTSVASIK